MQLERAVQHDDLCRARITQVEGASGRIMAEDLTGRQDDSPHQHRQPRHEIPAGPIAAESVRAASSPGQHFDLDAQMIPVQPRIPRFLSYRPLAAHLGPSGPPAPHPLRQTSLACCAPRLHPVPTHPDHPPSHQNYDFYPAYSRGLPLAIRQPPLIPALVPRGHQGFPGDHYPYTGVGSSTQYHRYGPRP